MQAKAPNWKVGDIILDLYKVTGVLGEGGFGTVYKVRHQGWNIDLAMKSPKPETVEEVGGVENFEREAETWVNLGLHPHIVSCYYVRCIQGRPLVFAEYMAGGSLQDWIGDRRLYAGGVSASLKRILDISIQLAWGLHYAHEQGLIHQDVKPANVMLTSEGVVKVTDFGLAKGRDIAAKIDFSSISSYQEIGEDVVDNTLLVTGSDAMTPAYCSPEQANRQTLTRRSDVWSWGLCVLEMFQGGRTWQIGTVAAAALEFYLHRRQEDSAGTFTGDAPPMPSEVAHLLRRCFRENPDERPRHMLDVANELERIYQQITGKTHPRSEIIAGKDIADSLNNRAVSLLDLGRQAEALQCWERALQIRPQHPESTYNRGLWLWRQGARLGDDMTLVRELEEVPRSQIEDWVAHYLLSLVHLERDDCEAAIKTWNGIQGAYAQHKEVQAALVLAQVRLSNSKRLLHTIEVGQGHLACLSADGQFAVSGSDDCTLKLWDVATGRCLRTFKGHTALVSAVCLSPDGELVVSGSDDYTLKLWEASTGRCLGTLTGHIASVNSVSLSADCRLVLSGSRDKTMKLWEVSTGRCLHTFAGHTSGVKSVCLSEDCRFALSGSSDNTLKLWEVSTGLCLPTFEGIRNRGTWVTSVCLSGDCQFALSASSDNTLNLWEVRTGRCLRTFVGHMDSVTSACLSQDCRFALSGSSDNTLKLWEVSTGRCLRTFTEHTASVTSVSLSGDGRFALSRSRDGTMKLWAVSGDPNPYLAPMRLSRPLTTEILFSIRLAYQRELKLALVALDRRDYVSAAQHLRKARSQPGYSHRGEAVNAWSKLYVYLPRKTFLGGWESTTFAVDADGAYSVALCRDGRFALSGSQDCTLKLWEIATGRCLRTFAGHAASVKSVALSRGYRYALSGSDDCTLKLWEVATGHCLRTFEGHIASVKSVALSADYRFALSGSHDFTLKLWEVVTGRCLRTFEGHADRVRSVGFSVDCRFALSGSDDGTLKLWEIVTGRCLHTFVGHTGAVNSVSFSVDGRYALSGSQDCTLKLWEIATGCCLRTFAGHSGAVNSVSFSVDGRYALSGSQDCTLKLWEVATGCCLRTFAGHTRAVNSVVLSADCRFALSGSNKTLKLWVLDWELEDRKPTDWDERGRPYLEAFLTQQTPYAAALPEDRSLSEEEITLTLTRYGSPAWTQDDFQNLMYTLGCAGYGWLRSGGVRYQLETMAGIAPKSPSLVENTVVAAESYSSPLAREEATEVLRDNQASVMPPISQTSAKVILTVTQGSIKGQEFIFNSRCTCIIGRAKDCYPQLPNDDAHRTISRYHCLLDINPPDIRVRDFGSRNGTYVNNKKIGQRQFDQTPEEAAQFNFPEYDLKAGDIIQLGNTLFQVNIHIEGEKTPSPELFEAHASTTKIKTETPPFSAIMQDLLEQAKAGESKLLAIQGYTILRELGQGGCGAVYLARHEQSGEQVALKIMLPKVAVKSKAKEMFRREIENNKALQHPNVVQLLDYGDDNGTFFFTLEYCDGGSVVDLMQQRGGKLSVDEAIPIILQTLDGLEYAHNAEIPCVKRADGTLGKGRGLVHRDLKPHNILLSHKNGSRVAKIADYGLAKAFDLAGLSGQTMSGTSAGTPTFMPRQQVISFKYAKPEVDIWATAASLYNMLTGTYPRDFTKKDPFLAVLQTSPVPIRQRDDSIPQALAELIDLALVDNPDIHFKNAAAFKRALESVLS
ncbi:MAG TPA: protein kinase [Allocoleopsis sp.]